MSTSTSPRIPPAQHRHAPDPITASRRHRVIAASVVTLVLMGVTGGIAAVHPWHSGTVPGPVVTPTTLPTVSPSTSPSPATSPSSPASPSPATSPSSAASPSLTASPSASFRFQPLWPFGSVAQARSWQVATASGGQQSWRLDPEQTALSFAQTYLGFTEIDHVVSQQVVGDEAWVGVAISAPEGKDVPAAVLHLARIGDAATGIRPWDVVGSEDTWLSLTQPAYGSAVDSTFTVGGRITGVDESLTVTVRSQDTGVLGQVIGVPAGGVDQRWQVPMTVDTTHPGVAAIVVSTGGHIAQVEKFAITAVRIATPASAVTHYVTAEAAVAPLVANGHYVGACADHSADAPDPSAVCSALQARSGSHYLYRIGYLGTDVGYFAVLGKDAAGWFEIDPYMEHLPQNF